MSVEEIAASLVQEFLSRKRLKQTLAKMDEELPRTPESISKRPELARALNIERHMRRNKEKGSPLRTMLEVIVHILMENTSSTVHSPATEVPQQPSRTSVHGTNHESSGGNPSVVVDITPKEIPPLTASPVTHHPWQGPRSKPLGGPSLEPVTSSSRSTRRGLEPRGQRGFKPRSITEWESDQLRSIDRGVRKTETGGTPSPSNSTTAKERVKNLTTTDSTSQAPATKPGAGSKSSGLGDLLCEDLEHLDLGMRDQETGFSGSRAAGRLSQRKTISSPILLETARSLRELIFGSACGTSFNSEWRRQDFTFCELPGLEYGLVQHKGGPCGVLACVQAYILKHTLFKAPGGGDHRMRLEKRKAALVSALVDILWMLGRERGRAIVALPPSLPHAQHSSRIQSRSYTPDHLTERAVLYSFSDRPTLEEFLSSHVFIFQEESKSGCINFLLSALLTRGTDRIRAEMDEGGGPLIGAHSYCSQALVNLLLTGHAVSNVFDGDITLDSGSVSKTVLRGVVEQSQIGFLSLFEYYGNCIVGSNYKEPVFPIWIVCSESHFTVLFSRQRNLLSNWELEQKFDLLYYDGLANQEEEIRLTIDTSEWSGDEVKLPDANNLLPPLQLCIQTKWRNAKVEWNGTEPLL